MLIDFYSSKGLDSARRREMIWEKSILSMDSIVIPIFNLDGEYSTSNAAYGKETGPANKLNE